MRSARFKVSFAGPLVTYQDAGRFGKLRNGVPASGPMDRFAHAAAHAALAQDIKGTAIEVSLGGLSLECIEGAATIAVTGGNFHIRHNATDAAGWGVHPMQTGDKLAVRAGTWGSWCYLAFSGLVAAPAWLGSTATHALSGFGGGALRSSDVITVDNAATLDARLGEIACPDFALPSEQVPIVLGPQDHHFPPATCETFLTETYSISDAYDRMGMRLAGPKLQMNAALSIPSEPIMRGSVQVSGDGTPTILLADHQTTGGYPKIATVPSYATDRLSQKRAGDPLRFSEMSHQAAQAESLAYREQVAAFLAVLAKPKASLQERLMSVNLIDGVVSGHEPDNQSL